ncbi:MAG: selenium cofactor biosynthesis protein YqeC [Dehalococcoidia bacterium]
MSPQLLHDALSIRGAVLLATVGGGGKTTLLVALARERALAHGEGVSGFSVLTTTTKMTIPPDADSLPLVLATNPFVRAAAIEDARQREQAVIFVGGGRGERDRILAVEPQWPKQALTLEGVGLVCVEADGAAGRAFKAPAGHEPVLPEGVNHVLAVVGVSVLGKSLDGRAVHRPEQVAALSGASSGDAVTPAIIAAVLAHPEGGRKQVPDEAQFAVVVTQAARDPEGTKAIAAACHDAGIERVVGFDAREELVRRL